MKIRVTFDTEIPDTADPSEIEEWLNFQLGGASIYTDNILVNEEIEATGGTLKWEKI